MSTTSFSAEYVWRARSFVWAMLYRDIKARYASSLLGALWLFLEPLLLVLALTFAFTVIDFRVREGVPYVVFFYSGILTFNVFRTALTAGCTTFWREKILIRKQPFPKEILVCKELIILYLDFLAASAIFLILLPFYGYYPNASWLVIPLYLAVLGILAGGTIFLMATLNVFLRDVERLSATLAQLMFWVSPVIFDFSGSAIGRVISYCNPLAGIVTGIREIILVGNISTWSHLLLPAAQSCIVFIVGYAVFRRYERRFIDVL